MARHENDHLHMSDAKSDSSESDSLDFSVVDICPLEGNATRRSTASSIRAPSWNASGTSRPLSLPRFRKSACAQRGASTRKQWTATLRGGRCASAWYEPGHAPENPGKPPKQRKCWKNAYLALRPEEGPTSEETAAREDKIARHEAKIASWQVGKKAGCFTIKGKTLGGKILLSPADGKGDKGAMREFYKNVRSKPKGKSHKGRESSHVSNFG